MQTKLSIFCEKIIEAGWLAAIIAVPLFFNIYSARTFEPDKITLLRSIALLMSLAWGVMVVEQGRTVSRSVSNGDSAVPIADYLRNWLKIPLFLPTALFVIFYIISTIFSISPLVSLWGSYQRLQGTYSALSYIVIFALMAGTLRTKEQVNRLITIAIVASIPVSLYGIVQRYGLDPLPWAGDVTTRVASTLGNAIFVASYLIMVMPLTIIRLVKSMTAIVTEEEASWGHTVLAAVYIFALAIQTLTVIFSQSRGPMLGILGAGFVMGLLLLLILRQLDADTAILLPIEFASGLVFVAPLLLVSGLLGGIGYYVGIFLENALLAAGTQIDTIPLLSAAIGGLLGFLGTYTYMAVSEKGWRWLWISWLGVGAVAILFILGLNLRDTGFDPYLNPIRDLPYVSRLSQIIQTEGGTGRVRVLIWDAALELVKPHGPLGVPDDDVVGLDPFNTVRPFIGYGPESMFNAFAYVYPPELAHVENRGSSADRSHNETVDTLVITGLFGFLAFYFLMIALFYYALKWLGWVSDETTQRGLIGILLFFGLSGGFAAYLAADGLTFVPLGLPFGLILGVVVYLIWRAIAQQPDSSPTDVGYRLTLIGLLGAIIGHFIEVHFVFSIAATYTYFWVYAGLMLAISRMIQIETEATAKEETPEEAEEVVVEKRPVKKGRRWGGKRTSAAIFGQTTGRNYAPVRESWEKVLMSQSLAMAMILIIITFDFITPQFAFTPGDSDSMSLLWMFAITWIIGLAVAFSDLVVRQDQWLSKIQWGKAAILYVIPSLLFFIYYAMHKIQLSQRITVTSSDDIIRAAGVLANSLVIFYVFLFLLMTAFALMLSWGNLRRLSFWRAENWWLYLPLIIAILMVMWVKNINVVRADIFLKEGDRYRSNQQWNEAIALHDKARSLDSDEDFYYLMLALDYQLMAQDGRLGPDEKNAAWRQGEEIALEARRINPYNPDNTGNMGRYYFTLGQIFDPAMYDQAIDFFDRATVLAPSNVIYHNLWAQTYYVLQDYEAAIDRLKISTEIDPRYPPTWVLLGDAYAAKGEVDPALKAHSEGMNLVVRGSDGLAVFADQFLDQRLNFYISAGRLEDIVAAMEKVAEARPDSAHIQWAIGHAYNLAGQPDQAVTYLEKAVELGDNSTRTIKELANIYLAMNNFQQAQPLYQFLVQNVADVEAHSALAFIYAQQGNVEGAIEQNQQVLQQLPNDYDSLKNLAILYRDTTQFQEALTFARQAKAAAPEGEAASWDQFISEIETRIADAG